MPEIVEGSNEVVGHPGCGGFCGPIQPPTCRFKSGCSGLAWSIREVMIDVPAAVGMERQINDDGSAVDDLVQVPASDQSRVRKDDLCFREHALQHRCGTKAVEVGVRHDAMNLRKGSLGHAAAGEWEDMNVP